MPSVVILALNIKNPLSVMGTLFKVPIIEYVVAEVDDTHQREAKFR